MKKVNRVICCVFALMIVFSMLSTTAFADSEVLGSPESQTGYFLPDDITGEDMYGYSVFSPYKFLFKIQATEVREILTTWNTAKTILKKNLPYTGIYMTGKIDIYKSGTPATKVKVGVCYHDSFHDLFKAEEGCYAYFTLGEECSAFISTSSMKQNTTYYAFVRNAGLSGVSNGGYVSGSVSYTNMD